MAAAEVAVFFGATLKALNAESRIHKERDDDIRAAVAAYESGLVQPALTRLVEQVIDVRRPGESVADALSREDVNRHFVSAVDASVRSRTPRARQVSLVHRNNWLALCLVAMHVAAPVALYNVLTSGYNLPQPVIVVAAAVFCIGATGAIAAATMVRMGENALAKVIGEGKDAA